MSYLNQGYDRFLSRTGGDSSGMSEMDPLQSDTYLQQISGSKIQGGLMTSADGKVSMDLDKGLFKISNGIQDLASFGLLSDGTIGLQLKDGNGNLLMQISESTQIIQSSQGAMSIDLIAEQILIKDQAANVRVLIGKDIGGF